METINYFDKLFKVTTSIFKCRIQDLLLELILQCKKAEKEGYKWKPGTVTLQEYFLFKSDNVEKWDWWERMKDVFSKQRKRGLKKELQESFYVSFIQYFNEKGYSSDIAAVKKVFEKNKIVFTGDNIKLNIHVLLKCAFPFYYNASDSAITENAVLDDEEIRLTSSIPERTEYLPATRFYRCFTEYNIDDKKYKVPFKEIYGIQQGIRLVENENMSMIYAACDSFNENDMECRHCERKAKIREYVVDQLNACTDEYFKKAEEENRNAAKERGYIHHPSKLWITGFRRLEINPDRNIYQFDFEFGCSSYLQHLIYQDILKEDDRAQEDFMEIVSSFPQSVKFNQSDRKVWSRAGGGVWLVTEDDYLIVSYRGETVNEIPGVISYSASGGFDRKIWNGQMYEDGSPSKSMIKEIKEELNVEMKSGDLEIISFGIDLLGGPWMQFSFFGKCGLRKDELTRAAAKDNHEFRAFFVPFTKDAVRALLRKAKMEAGAEYSLYEIMEHRM